jgi:putative selenium metabolism protein SsnA
MIVRNARVLTFDSANRVLDSASVEVLADGAIGAVGAVRRRAPDEIDARGRLLMPALINAHSHLYGTLARGMALPGPAPENFAEILKKLWWRLDCALDARDVYHSALVGLVDSAKCGVGTVIDHHSSPNACPGSLDHIERAFREVGLRGALCYENSDRNGPRQAREGFQENVRFIERARGFGDGLLGASFGLHACFTLSDRTLRRAVEANQSLRAGFHIHVAEDRIDAEAVRRLREAGALDAKTVAAHCLHVTAAEIAALQRYRVNAVHNPQSNCNNAVGMARLVELMKRGVLVGLGSDGYSPRMWDEFKTALHVAKLRAGDPRAGYAEAYAAAFLNNREIVRKVWGMDIGRIETGARADLILVDYFPPTLLDSGNLPGHLLFGISNAPVDSLMVDGRWIVRDKVCVTVDERGRCGAGCEACGGPQGGTPVARLPRASANAAQADCQSAAGCQPAPQRPLGDL